MPPRHEKRTTALLMVVHLLLVMPLAGSLNIWADEASTMYSTEHGFWNAFQNAATVERQAPLYFWLMSLWRSVDHSIFFARTFSVLCCVAAIAIFAGLAKRLLSPRAALLATAFLALHPFLIWASLEIRVYAMVILLSAILLRLFFAGLIDEQDRPITPIRIAFTLTSIVAIYTNYYLLFVLGGLFVALVATRRWKAAAAYFGAMVLVMLAFIPLVTQVLASFGANTSTYIEPRSVIEGIRVLWHHCLTYLLPAGIFPETEEMSSVRVARLWIARAALVGLVILTIRAFRSLSERTAILGIIAGTTSAGLMVAYFLLGPAYVEIRHASIVFVPLILFMASLLSDVFGTVGDRVQKVVLAAAGLILLLSFAYSIRTLYPQNAKRGDWARIGEFIMQNEAPGQPIVVFTTFDALALPYHYRGVNKVLPDEKYFDFGAEADPRTEESLLQQTDFVISEIPADAQAVWLVVNEKCIRTRACVPLENYIRTNYTIEKEQDFYLEKLYLLRRK